MNEKIYDFENIEDIFPLSDIQMGMIYESLIPGTASVYYNQAIIPFRDKNFDFERFKHAVYLLVDKHLMLRTGFNFEDSEEPVQVVYKKVPLDIEYHDLCLKEPTAREDYIKSCLRREREKFFDIAGAEPLWRIRIFQTGQENIYFTWINHHAIHDGWSFASFMTELNNTYLRLRTEPHFVPAQLKSTYKNFIIDQVIEKKNVKTVEFWRNELSAYKRFEIPGGVSESIGKSKKISIIKELGVQTLEKLVGISKKYNISLRHICFAAYVYTLNMVSYENDFVVGLVTHNRPECEDGDKIMGCFLNEVPVRVSIPAQLKWIDFIRLIDRKLIQLTGYNKLSLFEIARITGESTPGKNPFFDTIFNYTDFHIFNRMDRSLLGEIGTHGDGNISALSDNTQIETNTPLDFSVDISGVPLLTVSFFDAALTTEMGEKLCRYFMNILRCFSTDTGGIARKEAIMGSEEREKILYEFNKTAADFPRDKTIHQLFEEHAKQTPDSIALVGGTTVQTLRATSLQITYRQLNEQSNHLAWMLQEKGVLVDDIVGIMMERSVEMIIGLLGILKSGGAYLPIDPSYPQERIDYMLKDSNAQIMVGNWHACSEELNCQLSIVNCELLMSEPAAPIHHSSQLAYVIYTSGSTGKPKGVLTTHANVTRVVKNTNYIDITTDDRVLQLSNYAFDGSVFDIYGALLNGASLVLIKKETAAAVDCLAETIKREQVTVFFVTTALFNVLVDLEKSSLKNVRKILFGGERVSVEHTRKALAYLGKGRIIHVYGPTETTVYASYYFIDAIAGDALTIPIGKPLSNTIIYIVDKSMNPAPIGVRGEIYIGGEGTARGYLNNPELTKQKFLEVSEPFFKKVLTRRRLYQTGDLGRWLPDGNIEFLGRIDQQIKIRGFRVELGEIESRLLNYPGMKDAVVLAREEAGGDKSLCAYTVSESNYDETGIREFLLKELPEYMIPSYFVRLEKIPLNPNGKVDRRALPKPGLKVAENYTAPRNEVEKKLVGLWSEILGLPTAIGIDENFFRLGGHSLKATILASRIHRELNVLLPLAELFKAPTIRGLSQYINGAAEDSYKSIMPVEKKEYYDLSSAQKRVYILQQMDLSSTAYNMSNVLLLPGEFQVEKLAETFKTLIKRHESLRTSFQMIGAQPVQRIHEHVEFEIKYYSSVGIHHFIHPFELANAPLLRVGLVKNTGGSYFLAVDMHHIISDGVSLQVLVKDFLALYRGDELQPLRVQYKDFAEWQNREKEKENHKRQEDYWLRQFEGEIPILSLPTDFSRSVVQRLEGDTAAFDISREETRSLNEIARSHDGTLFMVLLAIFNIFLAKVSNREVIIVGTPTAGRKHADLEQVIGMFVNTLALGNEPSGDKTFSNFYSEVKEKTLQAFENQDYQFEDLVEKVVKNRDQGRNPLFDVMFALQNFSNVHDEDEITGSRHRDILYVEEISKFDLSLDAVERGEKLYFIFAYGTKLFSKETILRFIQYFKKIITSVIDNPGKKILELEIISVAEKQRLLFDFNRTATGYPKDKTIHQLFAEQVETLPDKVALVGAGPRVCPLVPPVPPICLTYRQLNKQSDQMAGLLIKKGARADQIIALKMERSIEMIIGMLGILKSGSAYLPIDPGYPRERIDYMLKDSGAMMLMNLPQAPFHQSSIIDHHSNHLAYVIYTSGSTGRPRGVMVEHRNVVRLVKNAGFIDFSVQDRLLPTGSPAFDITTFEIWGPLCNGVMLSLVTKDVILNAGKLKEVLVNHDITILHLIPQLFNQLAGSDIELFARLRYFLVGGDLVSSTYINTLRKKYSHLKILHMYGPTENTTFSTFFPVEKDYEFNIPIGTPIANSTAYIIDKYGYLQPIGVMGELCVGGEGIARGYLNHPELTSEKFKHDLWDYRDNHDEKNKRLAEIIYKTGDLARWLSDGNIEFLGRIDQQIKIRGFRVELGEIENRLVNYPGIKETVVSVLAEEGGDKYLCAYIVSERQFDAAGLREFLLDKLPGYMIPSYFVRLEKMPLTPNGKIDRHALPKPGLNVGERYAAPRDEIEKKLVELWAEILGRDAAIGIDDNFFQLGGHSLKATILASGIHKELNVIIALGEIFKAPTIRNLGEYIKNTKNNIQSDIDRNLVLLKEGLPGYNHLFFIHDGRGEIEGYIELCKHLTVDFNYWGIRAARNITIRELAETYIDAIKKIQPQGPYHIAGWSLGGTIAFEMAAQLEQSGEEIAFLALIDSPPPHKNLEKEAAEFNKESLHHSNLSKTLLNARALYKPAGKIHTPVHYVAAGQSRGVKKEHWQKYSAHRINYYEIPGDHITILKMPQVIDLAKLFSKILKKALFN